MKNILSFMPLMVGLMVTETFYHKIFKGFMKQNFNWREVGFLVLLLVGFKS
jgi:hypothetical protein